jgi:hypothetical protein
MARGFSTVQCGSGWVSGTPGLSTRASSPEKSSPCRLVMGKARGLRLLDGGCGIVPRVNLGAAKQQASMQAVPERASPKTATRCP